jgi:hypothetical protein
MLTHWVMMSPISNGLGTKWLRFFRYEPRIEDALAIAGGIEATIEVEIRTFQVQTHLFGYLLQSVQPLGKQHHIRFIDGSHRDRR